MRGVLGVVSCIVHRESYERKSPIEKPILGHNHGQLPTVRFHNSRCRSELSHLLPTKSEVRVEFAFEWRIAMTFDETWEICT